MRMAGLGGYCFGIGDSLAVSFDDATYLFEQPYLADWTISREMSEFDFGFVGGSVRQYRSGEWTIDMSFRCGELKKAQGDIRQHLREQASKLSVAELLDVINTKLDFRGQN